MSTKGKAEVLHKDPEKMEKPDIDMGELIQINSRKKVEAFALGAHWTRDGRKMLANSAKKFNNLMWNVAENGTFKSQMKKTDAVKMFIDREKRIRTEVSKGEFSVEKQQALYQEINWEFIPKKKEKEKVVVEEAEEHEEEEDPLIREDEDPRDARNRVLEARIETLERRFKMQDDEETKEFIDKTLKDIEVEIPPSAISEPDTAKKTEIKQPEVKDSITIKREVGPDEKQRIMADTFPNTKRLQSGCLETVKNSDYGLAHYDFKKLRPEYNFTKGITSNMDVKQHVDLGGINKYILR